MYMASVSKEFFLKFLSFLLEGGDCKLHFPKKD